MVIAVQNVDPDTGYRCVYSDNNMAAIQLLLGEFTCMHGLYSYGLCSILCGFIVQQLWRLAQGSLNLFAPCTPLV